jgi:hypothetical protein
MVRSLADAEGLCDQAVERWFERRAPANESAKAVEAVFDDVLERCVASRFAFRVVRDRCKTVMFPAPVNVIAGLTAFAIANTLKL